MTSMEAALKGTGTPGRPGRDEQEVRVWSALSEVCDPEIPVLSLVDLKIIRSVKVEGEKVSVQMTPTFSGCPALNVMKQDVEKRLLSLGFKEVLVEFSYAGEWTTDALDESTRKKLRAFGIAPPVHLNLPHAPKERQESLQHALAKPVACPFCGSEETKLDGFFGSTLCKQLYYCDSCKQSFDRFKPV